MIPEIEIREERKNMNAIERAPRVAMPYTVRVYVSPAMAQDWINNQDTNRHVRRRRVDAIARDIQRGAWDEYRLNSSIGIGTHGRMIDGQHRCLAIIQADQGVWTMVTFDVPLECKGTIDRGGEIRTASDVRRIAGKEGTHHHIAIVKAMVRRGQAYYWSDAELDELLDRHWDALEAAVRLRRHERGCPAPVYAVFCRAWYTEDRDRLEHFLRVVSTGVMESPDDVAAVRLRNWILETPRGGGNRQVGLYQRTQSALRHFLDRKPITKLYGTEVELWPLSDD